MVHNEYVETSDKERACGERSCRPQRPLERVTCSYKSKAPIVKGRNTPGHSLYLSLFVIVIDERTRIDKVKEVDDLTV